MKWSIGDRIIYEYRPDSDRFGGAVHVDYFGEIVDIRNDDGHILLLIKFDTVDEICSYRTNHFVVKNMRLSNSKFEDNNPNRTFRGKHVET